MNSTANNIEIIGKLVSKYAPELSFSIFEIGAVPLPGEEEPFYKLLDIFPNSTVTAFEVDEQLCAELNKKSRSNITFYPTALSFQDGEQAFYETNAPMCSSLYKPNEELLNKYNNLEVALLKSQGTMKTACLDSFMENNQVASIDFIKIDIQGAELDVFKGGSKALQNTVCIVSEVEFIPLYVDQPLFGDVCQYLAEKGFMFHKFLDLAGRALKPVVVKNDVNFPTQHMWSDAVFIKDINKLADLPSDNLLKLAILAFIYASPDLTFYCLQLYDEKENTNIHQEFMRMGRE